MTMIIGADAAKLAGLQVDMLQKVRSGQITLEHWEWFNLLTKEDRDRLCGNGATSVVAEKPRQPRSILRLISGEENLVIDATDGTETIPVAGDVFSYIDPDFKNWGADEARGPTLKTSVKVYEMVADATFAQMFGSLGTKTEKLCLAQSQIVGFVKKRRRWLRTDGYATFFLFRSKGKFFVACVSVDDHGRLGVHVGQFEDGCLWCAEDRLRLVVPQL